MHLPVTITRTVVHVTILSTIAPGRVTTQIGRVASFQVSLARILDLAIFILLCDKLSHHIKGFSVHIFDKLFQKLILAARSFIEALKFFDKGNAFINVPRR